MSTKLNFNNDFDKIYGYDGDLGAIYSKAMLANFVINYI